MSFLDRVVGVVRINRLPIALFALALAMPMPASAQYFGRNKVQYDEFDFRVLRTPHFDFHYYPEEALAVEDVARMGERWYERYARLFQHEFEAKKPVILYADHPDFQQTNTLGGSIGEGTGGVTESLKNRVIMPLAASYWDTDHVLGHELVHAFQYNIAQSRRGGGIQGLGRLPLWLIEGMAEYLSVGREDALTAMWMRDAVRRDDFPTIQQMTRERRFFPYRFGQALWAYVGGTYGDDAVVNLFRRSLRVGWTPALRQVLGISSDTLSARWKAAVEESYLPMLDGRTIPGEFGTLILAPSTGAGRQNVAPAVSPDGRRVVFLSEKDLFSVDLYLADAATGDIIRKLSSAASDPHADALRFIDSSGSWSPDGSQFVFVVFADGDNQMVIVSTDGSGIERRITVGDVGAVANPSWSPDGRWIVFSGQKGGLTDLYMVDLENSDNMIQLTNDRYADMQPTWSPDGTRIAFASDRGPETNFDRLTYGRFQIAIMDVETANVDVMDLFGDVKHANPQFAPNGQSLYFISDQDGFSDIYRVAFESGEIRRVTRIQTGVSGITSMSPAMTVASRTGRLVFSVFDAFEFHVYALDAQEAGIGDIIATANEVAPGRLLPPADADLPGGVKSYLADHETGLVAMGTYSTSESDDYESELKLDYVGQPTLGVSSGDFGTYVGGGAALYFSDMLGDRNLGVAFQANGTLKDVGGQVFYQNMAKRLNWGIGGGRIPYVILRSQGVRVGGGIQYQQLRQRVFVDSFTGMASYPFSTTRRIEGKAGFTRYSYDVEEEQLVFDSFGQLVDRQRVDRNDLEPDPLNLFRASVALVGDNSFSAFTSPVRGGRYRLELERTIGSLNFNTLIADWRRYFNPKGGPFTIAVRGLHYGRYGGDIDEPNGGDITNGIQNGGIQPLFLGFETFIRGYAWESFEAAECSFDADGNCPEFDRLFGQRIGVVNLEVRLPLFGTEQFGLLDMPYIPTELIMFSDMGMAWDGDNPLDLRFERNTTDRVPVFSTGVGARFNILGFLILEAYYAKPWQRPLKDWHWGFSISPGF